ncbi:MAG: ATP-binding cassette domain-containing protein [Treponema sp.]|nr:ATP-binding cassette domain-containing protein [Treponema sp.]
MIEIKNLTKEFKTAVREEGVFGMFRTLFSTKYTIKTAVNNISLKINDGEMVGYIGSNGAGKSTTIKMMCGILTPTRGSIEIDGIEPYKKRKTIASKIGVVFGQKTQLWWDIPLIESFKVLKEIYRISDIDYQKRLQFLYDVLGIKDFIKQPVRTLSLGQRMRADLAAAWLHNPKILFLDEPTIGLDVLVKEKIRNAIKMMNEKFNTTVILTTHDMQDIENLCKRLIIIDKGSIIYDGTLENVKYRFGDLRTLTVTLREKKSDSQLYNYEGKLKFLRDEENEDKLIIKFNAQEITLETVINYAFNQLGATDMKVEEIGIEDVVKKLL